MSLRAILFNWISNSNNWQDRTGKGETFPRLHGASMLFNMRDFLGLQSTYKSRRKEWWCGGGSWGQYVLYCRTIISREAVKISSSKAGFPPSNRNEEMPSTKLGRLLPLVKETHQNLEAHYPQLYWGLLTHPSSNFWYPILSQSMPSL